MIITFPLLTVVDDSGAIVSGATVTIASVTDKAGAAISSPGATINQAGPNVSVDYDAELHGEAFITLAISKAATTFTNLNAAPAFFLSADSSRLARVAAAVDNAQDNGTIVSATASILTVSGTSMPPGNMAGTRAVVNDAATKKFKADAPILSAVVSGSNVAITLAAPLGTAPSAGDTVAVF